MEQATCTVCPRGCKLAEGAWGFCEVRAAQGGSVQDMYYSALAAPGIQCRWANEDLSWSFPGMQNIPTAEVFLPGCNLKCDFCAAPYLAWISDIRGIRWVDPLDLVRALFGSVDVVGFSGGEPSIHVEYVTDVFSLCRDRGIRTCLQTNGFMSDSTARKLSEVTDFVSVGLKASLDREFYKRKLGVDTEPILDAIKLFLGSGRDVILTNLTDPNFWDDRRAFEDLIVWIVRNLGSEIPLVLAPLETVDISPPWTDERVYVTPRDQRQTYLEQYRRIATEAGLRRVFFQINVRGRSEQRRAELEKMGLQRTLQRLGMRPSRQEW